MLNEIILSMDEVIDTRRNDDGNGDAGGDGPQLYVGLTCWI